MKRMFLFAFLVFMAFGVSAQTRGRWDGIYNQRPPEAGKDTVTGNLGLVNGMIALRNDTNTYYVLGIDRLTGFIDGLTEGAAVTLEGFTSAIPEAPEYRYLRVTKLTFGGKDYDLSAPFHPRKAGPWNSAHGQRTRRYYREGSDRNGPRRTPGPDMRHDFRRGY
ncbi:MAG: hypothetical protein LBP32_08385 [Spirochaetaceae bacterium]|jgi:hypothetical protein|nr:hypothetical protein [Spirochaetaceae bacterium]